MAHNPPRPIGLSDPADVQRLVDEVAKRPRRLWSDLAELADLLEKRSKASKTVTMTASTAQFIAGHLRTAAAKPTRDEVAMMLCKAQCKQPCYECAGRANIIVRAYGQSIEAK